MNRAWSDSEGNLDLTRPHPIRTILKPGVRERNAHLVEAGPPLKRGCFVPETTPLTLIAAALLQVATTVPVLWMRKLR